MERFGVFVHGQGASDAESVDRLAQAARLARADAQQALVSQIPRRISDHRDPADAENRVLDLQGAGFTAFVTDLQELSKYQPAEARGAAFDGGGVSFRPAGRFVPGALRMILHGRFTTSTEVRSDVTIVDPRHPYARIGKGSGAVRSEQGEHFAHLYGATPGETVEVRANRFDFRCLGPGLAVTRAAGLRSFFEKLQALFPEAIFDDTLVRHPLQNRKDEDYSFSAAPMVGSLEQRSSRGSTESSARRASLLIARARLAL
jgi:hypothetical protein